MRILATPECIACCRRKKRITGMPAMTDAALTAWIGRTEEAQDQLSHNLLKRIAATLGEPTPAAGQPLPPLWQWCFFQEPVFETGLGVDGHPARGGFLP